MADLLWLSVVPLRALTLVVLLLSVSPAPGMAEAPQDVSEDPYARGLELRESGDWASALEVWERARESLGKETRSDPRIGIAFVETTVEHRAYWQYEAASEMYLWGFGGSNLETHADVVREEVERVLPLLDPEEAEVWRSEIEENIELVANRLQRFWVEKDPTPGSVVNERLMEHWQRIVYARENFQNNSRTVYRTDDRGLIYVKYGEPGMKRAGALGATEMELRIWVTDPGSAAMLRQLDRHPNYEVWVYDSLRPDRLTYFLFGNRGGTGQFELVDGVEDLISDAAYSPSSRRRMPGGIKAFYFLQLFYYGDLAPIGGPFARRHEELSQLWGGAESRGISYGVGAVPPRESAVQALELRYREENRSNPETTPTVASRSEYEARRREVEVMAWPMRVLSPEDEPRLVLMALSSPRLSLSGLGVPGARLQLPTYAMRHTLIVRDARFDEIGRVSNWVGGELENVSTFTLRHIDTALDYTVLAEVFASREAEGLAPGAEPLAAAQTVVAPPEPLTTAAESLELSDVLTGIEIPQAYASEEFPFPILPSHQIWYPDPVKVYLEVYHLALGEDGTARFKVDVEVTPVAALGRGEAARTITLGLDYESDTSRKAVAIDIANVPLGSYFLRVTVTDLISGQSRARTVPVELARAIPELG